MTSLKTLCQYVVNKMMKLAPHGRNYSQTLVNRIQGYWFDPTRFSAVEEHKINQQFKTLLNVIIEESNKCKIDLNIPPKFTGLFD